MTAPADSAQDVVAWVEELAPTYRWGGRQGIDAIEEGLEAKVLVATYADALADGGARVHDRSVGGARAATIRAPKPMESGSFGLVTAALSHVVSPVGSPDRAGAVGAVLDEAVAHAADDGVELLVLRVDADDIQTLAVAQDVGFRVCEATTTWLADGAAHAPPPASPPGLDLAQHEGEVAGVLGPEEIDRLAEVTAGWELNHFRADPRLPREGVEAYYRQWVHNIASGAWCDHLVVARCEGRLVGIMSEHSDRDLLAATGIDLRIGEWIVVLETGRGAGRAMLAAAGRHRTERVRYHSWETQLRNTACLRGVEGAGTAHPIRGAHTLHAWPRSR